MNQKAPVTKRLVSILLVLFILVFSLSLSFFSSLLFSSPFFNNFHLLPFFIEKINIFSKKIQWKFEKQEILGLHFFVIFCITGLWYKSLAVTVGEDIAPSGAHWVFIGLLLSVFFQPCVLYSTLYRQNLWTQMTHSDVTGTSLDASSPPPQRNTRGQS